VEVAHGHDGGNIVRHRVLGGQHHSVRGARLCGDKIDCGIPGNCACPLHIQSGFSFVRAVRHSRINAIYKDLLRVLRRQSGIGAEGINVGKCYIGAPHHRDALPAAIQPLTVKRVDVVNRVPVLWHQESGAIGQSVRRGGFMRRDAVKIMKRDNSFDHCRQRLGYFRIRGVGKMHLPLHGILPHLRVEGCLHLPGGPAENDGTARRRDFINLHPLCLKPVGNLGQVVLRDPEVLTEGLRCQPLVEVR